MQLLVAKSLAVIESHPLREPLLFQVLEYQVSSLAEAAANFERIRGRFDLFLRDLDRLACYR